MKRKITGAAGFFNHVFSLRSYTGKKVMAQAAEHLIPVELELGGKDPMVVFDDVNIERTVNGL